MTLDIEILTDTLSKLMIYLLAAKVGSKFFTKEKDTFRQKY